VIFLLLSFAYAVGGFVTAIFLNLFAHDEADDVIAVAFWPIIMPIVLWIMGAKLIVRLARITLRRLR
jgi:hypothetical protein